MSSSNTARVEEQSVATWQKAASASVGAVLTNLFATPLDVVKTRMQTVVSVPGPETSAPPAKACCDTSLDTQRQLSRPGCIQKRKVCQFPSECRVQCVDQCRRAACQGALSQRRWQASTVGTMLHLARTEGLRSLWSGLSPALVMAVPSTALYFTAYEELRGILTGVLGDHTATGGMPVAALLAGATARTVAASVISPLELIRTKMQSRSSRHGIVSGIRADMAEHGGVRGLWRGLGPTLWRDVPFSAMYWGGYEMAKSALAPLFLEADGSGSTLQHFALAFLCGSLSGSASALVTTPFDVVKTKRQAALYGLAPPNSQSAGSSPPPSTRTWSILRSIYAKEGLGGWFVGVLPRVAKVAPACAIMIGSYEAGKHIFAVAPEELQAWTGDA